MKKVIQAVLLIIISSFVLAGCGKTTENPEDGIMIYYLSNAETKIESHFHALEGETTEEQVEEVLRYMAENPAKLEYIPPLTKGFEILDVTISDGRITLNFDSKYKELPVTCEVLVRAALVRTLTQIEGINYVGIMVKDSPFFDSLGNQVGWMNAEQFIDNDGSEINTYELTKVKLYFANEDGTKLIAAYREKQYSTSTPKERFIVSELILGPSGKVGGLYSSINPATKIVNVVTKDGICYVNLSEDFLTVVSNVGVEVSVYSIVNSLVELGNINKVQILINGEIPSYLDATYERNLDIVVPWEDS